MHVAFALMIAVPAFMLVRNRLLKAFWAIYPALVTFVVMATANHFWMDAALGALVAVGVRLAPPPTPSPAPGPEAWAGGPRAPSLRVSDGLEQRTRRERGNGRSGPLTAAEMRALARNRLIESRLTPNAISITGLVGNLIAAALILEAALRARGVAFILGSLCDMFDGRYSRMSGKGTPFGAFLDSTLDRIEEGVVLAAVAAWFAKQGTSSRWPRPCSRWSAPTWSPTRVPAPRRSASSARSGLPRARSG